VSSTAIQTEEGLYVGKTEGKVAIVTAGGAGIGAATARRFAREKALVLIADLSGTRAREVAGTISQDGGDAAMAQNGRVRPGGRAGGDPSGCR
jgi:NAD(P)-dependent dehydrogenase (short-subunit alcohol dehydrogenase family)